MRYITGDTVTTKTGKTRVVVGIDPACPPAEFAEKMARFEAGRGVKPSAHNRYDTRALRDGKPFGPTRSYAESDLTLASAPRELPPAVAKMRDYAFIGNAQPGDEITGEWGKGTVEDHSPRRLFYRLEDGTPMNVAVGTPGYMRLSILHRAEDLAAKREQG